MWFFSDQIPTYFPAKTQSMLKAGAKAQSKKASVEESSVQSTNVCKNCNKTSESVQLAKCFFCDKNVCTYCFNTCCNCEQNFCPLCSVIRYPVLCFSHFCIFFLQIYNVVVFLVHKFVWAYAWLYLFFSRFFL